MRLVTRVAAGTAMTAALALGACGSSSTTTPTATGQTHAQTSTNAGTTARTGTTGAPTTAAQPPTPQCTAPSLRLSFLGQQGATGHGEIGFSLHNVSSKSCRTFGYPGVLFLARGGQPLPTASTRTAHDFVGAAPVVRLTIAPGASVSFRLAVTHGISSTAGCTTAYGLQVIPPDDTRTLRTTIPQGAYECGTTTVSPLQPGSSAFR